VTDPNTWTDTELVVAAGKGDMAAFEVLYHRHKGWVGSVALRFTRDHELALDAVQETFAYLARRVSTLTLTAKMTTFLYPVVRSTALTIVRKRGRAGLPGVVGDAGGSGRGWDEAGAGGGGDGGAAAGSLEGNPSLLRAIDALPDGQREVVMMRFGSGMALGDIAMALGVPTGTVKSRLHHALRALEERLREPG